jgi:Recombination endonuclease VII
MNLLPKSLQNLKYIEYKDSEEIRLAFLKFQKFRCAICAKRVPPEKMCLDHDHYTGYIRGLLCHWRLQYITCVHDNVYPVEILWKVWKT